MCSLVAATAALGSILGNNLPTFSFLPVGINLPSGCIYQDSDFSVPLFLPSHDANHTQFLPIGQAGSCCQHARTCFLKHLCLLLSLVLCSHSLTLFLLLENADSPFVYQGVPCYLSNWLLQVSKGRVHSDHLTCTPVVFQGISCLQPWPRVLVCLDWIILSQGEFVAGSAMANSCWSHYKLEGTFPVLKEASSIPRKKDGWFLPVR